MKYPLVSRLTFLRSFLAVFVLSVFSVSAQSSKPKYVFLMIGDGMGVDQVAVADKYKRLTENSGLMMNTFPVRGLATTHPADKDKTTDSAASGTALACGFKTDNGMIGMTPDKMPGVSIAAHAKNSGKKVAIISSVGINHATPAAFYGHQKKRNMYDEIGAEIASCNFDFLAGEPLLGKIPERNRKLIAAAGYKIINEPNAIKTFTVNDKTLIEYEIPYKIELERDSIRLVDFVQAGLKSVGSSEQGFFMMVEGGKIDWACHANDFGSILGETIEFDDAVQVAFEFYKKHPAETLIVVSADHETGDFKFDSNSTKVDSALVDVIQAYKSTSSSIADKFKEWKKNNLSAEKIAAHCLAECGVNDPSTAELAKIAEIAAVVLRDNKRDERTKELKEMYGNRNALILASSRLAAERCGASFSSTGHTSARVPVMAIGQSSELFANNTDNAEIGRKLIELVK